jgi:hypothetical protein
MPSEEQTKQIVDSVALVLKQGLADPRKCYTDVIDDVRETIYQEISALDKSHTTSVWSL